MLARLRGYGLITEQQRRSWQISEVIHYETEEPERTDENEVAADALNRKPQRAKVPWQKLTHRQMVRVLQDAESTASGVICAGSGRVLEPDFKQLDHVYPKAEGGERHILNRVLLCGPCNRRKRNYLSLTGLWRESKKKSVGWTKDESRAKMASIAASERAQWIRDFFHSEACQSHIRGD